MRRYRPIYWIPFMFHLMCNIPVSGQMSIAPTSLYIHDRINVASLQISNGQDAAREITVSFEFGYPASDSLGRLTMVYNDTIADARYGLCSHLRAFPRHFEIQPGGQQIVRVQVLPFPGKAEGVYWTRMIISSGEVAGDIDGPGGSDGIIGTRIKYIFNQNIAVFYRKGEVTTGIIPGRVHTSVKDSTLITVSKLKPSGNAPFNGSATVRLFNVTGKEVAFHQQTLTVYFEGLHRIEMLLPREGLAPGDYTLEFTYETKRNDIPDNDLVQSQPVYHKVPVTIR